MKELINLLNQINNREVELTSSASQDLLDVINFSKNKTINRELIREFLVANDKYTSEEDLDIFTRDLFTIYVHLHNKECKEHLNDLIREELNNDHLEELIRSGFKCYPVSYNKRGMVLGIITKVGHLVIE